VGVPFYGEVAPLPGFSVEGIDDALAELDSIAFAIPPLEEASLPLPRPWNLLLNSIHCPSLRCALEGVILDRLARTGALTEIFRKRPSVECNGLILGGTEQETLREITTRTELGFRTLKIKISPDSIETTLRALRSSNLSPSTMLRLDANRSFTLSEWSAIAPDLASLPIEYVEEPLRTPEELPSITGNRDIPIAIDESTRDIAPDDWLRWSIRAVVLKPSLNGGLLSLLPLISAIERHGAYITLSSSFESGVGLRSIALFAATLDRCGAIGIDTASFLKEDLVEPHFPRATPTIELSELIAVRCVGGTR
jgi:O-succinylbenzoate synthase